MALPSSTCQADPVHLHLHGYPTVLVGGRPAALRLKHALALIAYLSVRGGAVGRERLAALLWPDAAGSVVRARLRRLVHETHEQLGSVLLQGDADTLSLAPGCTSDWQAARQAIDTLARRPGVDGERLAPLLRPQAAHLLDGFSFGSTDFDDWLTEERYAHTAALSRALKIAAERALAQRDALLAEQAAAALLRIDRCSEPGHISRIAARAIAGDVAGVETAYFECAQALRDELGVAPSAAIESAYAQAVAAPGGEEVTFAYAPTSHGQVAYATWGRGPETVVVMWGLTSHLDVALEEPRARRLLDRLAARYRVVMLDRRGSGLSERVGVAPSAETAAEDVAATLDHLGVDRAWLFGSSVGGTLALDFALRHPARVAGLLLFGTSATGRWHADWPWAMRPDDFDAWIARLTDPAHYDDSLRRFAPSAAGDASVRAWFARLLRQATTPLGAEAILRAYQRIDLRADLHRVQAPTLVLQRRGDRIVPFGAGERLARSIPGARFVALDGDDHFLWHGDGDRVLDAVERFVAAGGAGCCPSLAAA